MYTLYIDTEEIYFFCCTFLWCWILLFFRSHTINIQILLKYILRESERKGFLDIEIIFFEIFSISGKESLECSFSFSDQEGGMEFFYETAACLLDQGAVCIRM